MNLVQPGTRCVLYHKPKR